jgi:beta-lactamase superfamily II metal-dependent hydrolase
MKVEFIKADKGDSIWISWEFEGVSESLLIDTGIQATYNDIKLLSKKFCKLSTMIITHVDYDHVGGLLNMLNDPKAPIKEDFVLYVNTANLILKKMPGEKVNYKHGIMLDKVLAEKDFEYKSLYIHENPLQQVKIKGLTLTLLSPTKEIIDLFIAKWEAEKILEQYIDDNRNANEKVARKVKDDSLRISDYFDMKESIHKPEKDLLNSSSIAFLLEYENIKWLMLGDSNPTIIEQQLKSAGNGEQNKLKVNYVKLSHHGCKHNTSISLLKMIECSKYVISTNGNGPYYHPDKETIAKLVQHSSRDADGYIDIYLNYPLTRQFLTSDEMEMCKVRITPRNEF